MSTPALPRCCECSYPLQVVEPFLGGVAQHHRCPSCAVHLHVRRGTAGWSVHTAAEQAGQRTAPLPASRVSRAGLVMVAALAVLLMRRAEGVEPGMSTVGEGSA